MFQCRGYFSNRCRGSINQEHSFSQAHHFSCIVICYWCSHLFILHSWLTYTRRATALMHLFSPWQPQSWQFSRQSSPVTTPSKKNPVTLVVFQSTFFETESSVDQMKHCTETVCCLIWHAQLLITPVILYLYLIRWLKRNIRNMLFWQKIQCAISIYGDFLLLNIMIYIKNDLWVQSCHLNRISMAILQVLAAQLKLTKQFLQH